ncbi:GPI anchored serine-threonine rich family protein [Thermoflexibacter ruber]|uniref:Ser-Thr-rich glycosyl-phosphatidyl-inositol-anchored membrane family protein n=1 Tax=Thermoflexibacter ruber TaxID=1003 RepID=A0A1I2DHV5_9BACT|nr:GPI anchored serine-threonine rich family protein [Thermoflexibacter ruber]SFE80222.1 Ser-Thr-rich glycosyl-phosphatidyl-inositol-anchored membrane family protein [Thermoflexibacter ruber]
MKYYLFCFTWLILAIHTQDWVSSHPIGMSTPVSFPYEANLKILTPTKGEVLRLEQSYKITWEAKTGGNVQIDLYKAEKLERTIEFSALSVAGANNVFTWQIPADIALGDDYQIMIFDVKDKENVAKSEFFSIQKSKKLPKWVIIAGSLGIVAIIGAVVLILGRPKTSRLPDPPNPDEGG